MSFFTSQNKNKGMYEVLHMYKQALTKIEAAVVVILLIVVGVGTYFYSTSVAPTFTVPPVTTTVTCTTTVTAGSTTIATPPVAPSLTPNILVESPRAKIIESTFVGDGDYYNLMDSINNHGKQPFKYVDYLYIAFADLDSASYKIYFRSEWEPKVKTIIQEAVNENPKIKIFAQMNWAVYLSPLTSKTLIDVFAKSIPPFLQQYNFSGIDFDWEQPALDTSLASYLFTQVKSYIGSEKYLSISADTIRSLDSNVVNQYVDIVNIQVYRRWGIFDTFINLGISKSKIYPGICTENDGPFWEGGSISTYTKKVTDLGLPGLYAWRIDNDDTDHSLNLPRYTITKAMWNFSRGQVPPL
jgi:hypothetical protein